MKNDLKQILIKTCNTFGRDPLFVQAGGGNISVKFGKEEMLIKASGCRMKEVGTSYGWTSASWLKIRQGLIPLSKIRSATQRELKYADLLGKAGKRGGLRISMEAGFHATLPETWVIHLHSAAGILLGHMPESRAKSLIRQALPKTPIHLRIVAPSIPGLELTDRMKAQLGRSEEPEMPHLWIQQSHGISWAGSDHSKLMNACRLFEKYLRKKFSFDRFPRPHTWAKRDCLRPRIASIPDSAAFSESVCFCRWPSFRCTPRPLFPDFVIYFDLWNQHRPDLFVLGSRTLSVQAANLKNLSDKKEVLYLHALVNTIGHPYGLRYLTPRMIRTLKNLETERLRLKQVAKR